VEAKVVKDIGQNLNERARGGGIEKKKLTRRKKKEREG